LVTFAKSDLLADLSGQLWVRRGVVNSFTIEDEFCFANTVWKEQPDGIGRNGVSLFFLTQFNITFDFPNSIAYLKKNNNFGHRDATARSGLGFCRNRGRVVVERVEGDSPAEKCGIRANDIIKAVGGKNVDEVSLHDLSKALWYPRERIPLVIERDSKTIEMELTLPEPRFVSSDIRVK
jgi:hypothetical protein